MQVYTSFRHMDASPALKEYAEEKIRKVVRKYIRDNFDAQVTLSVEKFRHQADILLSYKGLSIKCEGSSEDMYTSVDMAIDKLERQVRRYKDKLRRHKPNEGRDRLFELSVIRPPFEEEEDDFEYDDYADYEVDETDYAPEINTKSKPESAAAEGDEATTAPVAEAPDADAADKPDGQSGVAVVAAKIERPSADEVHVLKREVMTAHPMSVDDAIMQLDLEQRAFLVFTNDESQHINIIYRRADGNFGLIEPRK